LFSPLSAHAEQFNGREAKTATFYLLWLACVFAHVISTVRRLRQQNGNFTLLESNRTIRFNSSATILLKTKNFGDKLLAPFGVNSNGREGKLGRGENKLD